MKRADAEAIADAVIAMVIKHSNASTTEQIYPRYHHALARAAADQARALCIAKLEQLLP